MILYMPLFRTCKTLKHLTQLHAHLVITGLHRGPRPSTKLIDTYSQMGSLLSSKLIFQTFKPHPDPFMWAVLIKSHVKSRSFGDAISLYHTMLINGVRGGSCSDNSENAFVFVFPSVLSACGGFGDLGIGGAVHGRVIKCGFHADAVIGTSVLGMYGQLGCLGCARKMLDDMAVRDVVSWGAMISSCVDNGEVFEGLEVFRSMVSEGVELDSVVMLSVAEACGELGRLRIAKAVHGCTVRREFTNCDSLSNNLVVMYSKCGDLFSAERIFVKVANRSTTSCTAMISCYNRSGCFKQGLKIIVEMLESKVETNAVTVMSVLGSCVGLGWLREGKSVHGYAYKKEFDLKDDCIGPALVELYAECGKIRYCENVLHTVSESNVVTWNALISTYARIGLLKEALELVVRMQSQGLMPDPFSLSSSLSVCGNARLLQLGHQIHAHVLKRCILDEFVQNALIDMYSKCGCVDLSYLIFDEIQNKSVVTWNSMICGYSQNGKSLEAINLFDRMHLDRLQINEVTFLSAIQACSQLGHLERGKFLHHKFITYGVKKDIYIDTALTDMYAKCADLQTAQRVFNTMSKRSVVSWSVMIAAYGMHGNINSAISLFGQMVDFGMKPNDITFMSILSACAHSGFVQEGKSFFDSMRDFGVDPNSEHFACMVDLLSRAGDLAGAYGIINSMPFPADASIWGAFLNGCRIHQRIDMIQTMERNLLDINTDDSGFYKLLSNIYAEDGNWGEFKKVRSAMKGRGLKKVPGYSTIEIDKRTYRFGAGDAYHWQV